MRDQIGAATYDYVRASGILPGVMYGLVKVHKPNFPIRPIISSINTFSYNISKFLASFLNVMTINEYTIRKTSEFIDTIKELKFNSDVVLASFDVESLFTNIPLSETCDIIENNLHQGNYNLPIKIELFVKLLKIAVTESVFLFNSKYYKQVNGCSMGGPLSPNLANIFMCDFESKCLTNCPQEFKPVFYRRYVDDCFLVFRDISHVNKFNEYINNIHSNIKFTFELEQNSTLPFLDTLIRKTNDGRLLTSVYRKPTFTGLGLNFFSNTPEIFKINSIKTLLHRAYTISSNFNFLHDEICHLKTYFLNNKYPMQIIENVINTFLSKKKCNPPVKSPIIVPKLKKYIKLPFYGPESYKMRNSLILCLKNSFNHVNFRIVLSNPYKIGSFLKFKDKIPSDVQSRVIYEYKCSSCNARYIGSTCRAFKTRRLEHLGRSIHTGRPITNPSFSNIREHAEQENHPLSQANFKIIRSMPDKTSLLIAESLHIKFNNPSLNNHATSFPLIIADKI